MEPACKGSMTLAASTVPLNGLPRIQCVIFVLPACDCYLLALWEAKPLQTHWDW